jgi:CDP-diacylglycerol--serine O-phosphatidyltransferase
MGVLSALKMKDYFTLIGTFLGFCALITAIMTEAFRAAFIFVFFSILFDLLDGYVARKTNQMNDLGRELDSLSDGFCFAIVPSIVIFRAYTLPITSTAMAGWNPYILIVPAFIFTVCGLLRLAWFNILDSEGYTGLMTPLSAAFLAFWHMIDYYSWVYFGSQVSWVNIAMHYAIPFVYIFIGWCNITDFIYYGKEIRKKEGKTKRKILWIIALFIILFILAIFMEDYVALLLVTFMTSFLVYEVYFIIQGFRNYSKKKHVQQQGTAKTQAIE